MYLCKHQYGQHPEVVPHVVVHILSYMTTQMNTESSAISTCGPVTKLYCVCGLLQNYPPSDFVHTHSSASARLGDNAGSCLPKVLSVNDFS
jgi:hypothetical protein